MAATTTQPQMTAATRKLFIELFKSAPDWSGQPLFDGTKEERGNLTQLKKAGLLTTQTSEGCTWVNFTEAGMALGEELC